MPIRAELLRCLPQAAPCLPETGSFRHGLALRRYIRTIGTPARYAELRATDVHLMGLEVFGNDTWEVLCRAERFDWQATTALRRQLLCGDDATAFHPVAILSPDPAILEGLSSRYSLDEIAQVNEKVFGELANGRFRLSRAARQTLGSGFDALLKEGEGVPLYELTEMELTDNAVLLGWAWIWHAK